MAELNQDHKEQQWAARILHYSECCQEFRTGKITKNTTSRDEHNEFRFNVFTW